MSLVAAALLSPVNHGGEGAAHQGPLPPPRDIFFPSAQPFTPPTEAGSNPNISSPPRASAAGNRCEGPVQTQCLLGKPSGTQATEPPHLQRKGHGFHSEHLFCMGTVLGSGRTERHSAFTDHPWQQGSREPR